MERARIGLLNLIASALAMLLLVSIACVVPARGSLSAALDPAAQARQSEVREAIVRLKDGTRLEGVFVEETDESVTLRIRGVDTTIEMERISRVEILPELGDRYRAVRDVTPEAAFGRRLDLIRWLVERHGYELAVQELEAFGRGNADGIKPDLSTRNDAQRLLNYARAQVKLQREPKGVPLAPTSAPLEEDAPAGIGLRLTGDEVNLARVYEFSSRSPVAFSIAPGTALALLDLHGSDPDLPESLRDIEALEALEPLEFVRILFRLRARSLYSSIRVNEDPAPVVRFRDEVRASWLGRSCATSGCHGPPKPGAPAPGGFALSGATESGEDADLGLLYADWIEVDRFRMPDGEALLDHADPASSPLLHLGLPRGLSRHPHPRVRGWAPVFRSSDSAGFERAVRWIGSMRTPRPDWGAVYDGSEPR